jgi:hypothetical protein
LYEKENYHDLIKDEEGYMQYDMKGPYYTEMYLVQSIKNVHPNNQGWAK